MDEVLHLIIEAQEYAPNDPDVLTVLGVLCNVSMDYDYAVGCLENAVAFKPEDYSLHNKVLLMLYIYYPFFCLLPCILSLEPL